MAKEEEEDEEEEEIGKFSTAQIRVIHLFGTVGASKIIFLKKKT